MAHFAKVKNGIVTKVLVAEQDFINNYIDNESGKWIQTSYNTRAGQHELEGTPLRKNFARVGYIYDAGKDAFYEPQPYPSWTLNEESYMWESPVAYPNSEDRTTKYTWNERTQTWDEVT
jgi:hypothetical protein